MPQITSIEPQKRKAGRFNIYIDGQFAAGVSDLTLAQNNLKVSQTILPEELARIILKEETSKFMDRALRFLAVRPRSEKEISDHLAQKIAKSQNIKYSQARESHLSKQIIDKLKKYKYLNDLEFAKWWVNSRIRHKPKGLFAIRGELLKKGVERDIIQRVLEDLPNQTVLAYKAILKKINSWQKLSNLSLKKKVYTYLVSRGFDIDVIKEVFAKLDKKR